MTLKDVIAVATHLAAAVEAEEHANARRLAVEVGRLAVQSELQRVAVASRRVTDLLSRPSLDQDELGLAMLALADEIDRLVRGTGPQNRDA